MSGQIVRCKNVTPLQQNVKKSRLSKKFKKVDLKIVLQKHKY